MRKLLMLVLGAGIASGLTWTLFPTEVPARTFHHADSNAEGYIAATTRVIDYVARYPGVGLVAKGVRGDTVPLSITCRGVPVIAMYRHEDMNAVLVFTGAGRRIPNAVQLWSVVGPLVGERDYRVFDVPDAKMGKFERFILKYRDGVDLSADCV